MNKYKLVLGGNVFGCFADENETAEILNVAREWSVFSVDTADVYSNGRSEEILGRQLQVDRKKWHIATKVGLESHADPSGLGRRGTILNKLTGSLRRLKTDYIDLYQIHHFDSSTPLEETIECFGELIKEGKILNAGISNYNLSQLRRLVQRQHPFEYSQQPVNLCNYASMSSLLAFSREHKISIVAYSVLARGLLNEKYLSDTIPDESRAAKSESIRNELGDNFKNRLSRTRELCSENDLTVSQLALGCVANVEQVDKIIVGVRSSEQLVNSIGSVEKQISKKLFEDAVGIWNAYQPT